MLRKENYHKQQPQKGSTPTAQRFAKTNPVACLRNFCDCVCFVDRYMVHICVEFTWIVCIR